MEKLKAGLMICLREKPALNAMAMLFSVFALILSPAKASAKTVYEQIFATGTMKNAKTGDHIVYLQTVNDPKEKLVRQQSDLVIDVRSDDELVIAIKTAKGEAALGSYSKKVGNPVQMYFLEQVIKLMSKATGGSEFYLRNRIKEALANAPLQAGECVDVNGAKLKGECLIIKPFEKDKRRDRMGDFADLQLYFSFDQQTPAFFTGLHAKNPATPQGFYLGLDLAK